MDFPEDTSQQFLVASTALTGFSAIELARTGMADTYWNTLVGIVGEAVSGDFLSSMGQAFAKAKDDTQLPAAIERLVMRDAKSGPLARNVISMWYLGQWNALPREWSDAYGGSFSDSTQVVSAQAYVESLVWPAFGAHPQGAKPTGWGSWAEPPPNAAEIMKIANPSSPA